MKRSMKLTLAVTSLLLAAAAPLVAMFVFASPRAVLTDADTIRTRADRAAVRDVLWQPPIRLSEAINAPGDAYEPRLGWDGLSLYFVRGKAGGNADIVVARRTPAGWTEGVPLTALNSPYDDLGPQPAADGSAIYFYSDRPGGRGGFDLWVAKRRSDAAPGADEWLEPINLGPNVNSEFNDYGPAVTRDGKTLYFASNRPQPSDSRKPDPAAWSATVREDWFHRPYDLFQSTITPDGATAAIPLTQLNTPANEGAPCVSPAGDFLYFASDRAGGFGGFDLYRARVIADVCQAAENVGEPINTSDNELDPGLAQLGYALYFSSDRETVVNADQQPQRAYRVFYSASREVFRDAEPFDWAGAWAALWPTLLWLLLALLALLLLALLYRDLRDKRLSLLARCLLASLALHCLLLTLFGYWRVKAALGEFIAGRGQVQVTLATASTGSAELFSQVYGALTDVAPPEAQSVETARSDATFVPAPEIRPALLSVATTPIADQSQTPIELPQRETSIHVATETPQAIALESGRAVTVSSPSPTRASAVDEPVRDVPRETEVSPPRRAASSADTPSDAVEFHRFEPSRLPARTPDDTAVAQAGSPVLREANPRTNDSSPAPQPLSHASDDSAATPRLSVAAPSVVRPNSAIAEQAIESVAQPIAAPEFKPKALEIAAPAAPSQKRVELAPETRRATSMPADASSDVAATDAPPLRESSLRASSISSASSELQPTPATRLDTRVPLTAPEALAASDAPEKPIDVSTQALSPVLSARRDAPSSIVPPTLDPRVVTFTPLKRAPGGEDFAFAADVATERTPRAERAPNAAPPPLPVEAPRGLVPLAVALPKEETEPARASDRAEPVDDAHAFSADRAPVIDGMIGSLRGIVVDAETHKPLQSVTVRLDRASAEPVTVTTDERGVYWLALPPVPEFFAVTASADRYLPEAKNVPGVLVRGRSLRLDFSLRPETEMTIAIEDDPVVHHLGNDRFEGVINSQFQRTSEGAVLAGEFEVRASQLPPAIRYAEITLLVKGVQCPHQVRINGTLIERRLDRSPASGGFGAIELPLDPTLLHEGDNTIEIRAVSCRGDLDDFEFVNVQIKLAREAPHASR